MSYLFRTCLEWRKWVVPGLLHERPVHRWFVLPHSFTDDIVRALAKEWDLNKADNILDPFVGAGTTVLAAKQLGISAMGFDLSPLAILASNVKVANHDFKCLEGHWLKLHNLIRVRDAKEASRGYAELVQKALPGDKLATFHGAKVAIEELDAPAEAKDFFLLALLAQIPKFSNAVPTGGWLSWIDNQRSASQLPGDLTETIQLMFSDLDNTTKKTKGNWNTRLADARRLPVEDRAYSAIITSPPYPNRHDYTRVFGVELMFGFLDWNETRDLRYQTFQSHPESKPDRPPATGYDEPDFIKQAIHKVAKHEKQERVTAMLHGYFIDLFLSLKEIARVLRPGGHAALVLGNAQYAGVSIEVDKATANIGEQTGLTCTEIRVVRERGNSAQQMRDHGRHASRESVIIFRKDD